MRHFLIMLAVGGSIVISDVNAENFGRLFTTPEERAELDEARNDPNYGKTLEPVVTEKAQPTGPVVPNVTINGLVLRSSGINASWINGSSIQTSDTTREGITVITRGADGGTVQLELPGGLETIRIKPGQKIDLLSGGVFEPYEYQAAEGTAGVFEEIPQPADKEPIEATQEGG